MKSFIEKKSYLTYNQINELLYYYQQGIDIGKEETTLSIINNLVKLDVDKKIIAKAINISEAKLNQLLN